MVLGLIKKEPGAQNVSMDVTIAQNKIIVFNVKKDMISKIQRSLVHIFVLKIAQISL